MSDRRGQTTREDSENILCTGTEGKNINTTGETDTSPVVITLWDENSGGLVVEAQMDDQMR